MATGAPPDGWNLIAGTWGTNATQSGSGGVGAGGITVTSQGTTTTTLVSDWISLDLTGSLPKKYTLYIKYGASNIGARVEIAFTQYDVNKANPAKTIYRNSSTAFPVSGFQTTSAVMTATKPFGRWEITVPNFTTYSVTLYQVTVEKLAPNVLASASTAQNVTGSTTAWVPIVFGSVQGVQDLYFSSSGTDVGMYKAGFYKIFSNVYLKNTAWTAGTTVQIRIAQIDTGTTTVVMGPVIKRVNATAEDVSMQISQTIYNGTPLSNNDNSFNPIYQVQILHSYTATAATTVAGSTSFSVAL